VPTTTVTTAARKRDGQGRFVLALAVSFLMHAGAAGTLFVMPTGGGRNGLPPVEHVRRETLPPIHLTFVPMEPRRPPKSGPAPLRAVVEPVPGEGSMAAEQPDAEGPLPPVAQSKPEVPPPPESVGSDGSAAAAPPAPPVGGAPPGVAEANPPVAVKKPGPPLALPETRPVNPPGPALITAAGGTEAQPEGPQRESGSGDGSAGGAAVASSLLGGGHGQPGASPGQPAGCSGGLPGPAAGSSGKPGSHAGVEIVNLPTPEYPPRSRRLGEEGLVLLEVEVLPDGRAGKVRVLQSPDYPRLVAAAIEAVQKAKYKPAMAQGVPVSAMIEIPIRFRLD